MNDFDYINKAYGLDVSKGTRLLFQNRPATVVGSRGHYLMITFDYDDGAFDAVPIHPTWEVEYEMKCCTCSHMLTPHDFTPNDPCDPYHPCPFKECKYEEITYEL